MGSRFKKLAELVHKEYHGRPLHGKEAQHIERTQGREAAEAYVGKAVAAKVAREKERAANHPLMTPIVGRKPHRCSMCGITH